MLLACFLWSLGRFRPFSVLSIGRLSLLCRPLCRFIWVLTTKMSAIIWVEFLMAGLVLPSVFVLTVIFLTVFTIWLCIGLLALSRSVRSRVMPPMPWLLKVRSAGRIRRVMMLLILLQISAGFGSQLWLLMLGVVFLMPKKSGILDFCPCIGLWLLLPENLSIFLRVLVLLLTRWFGIGGLDPRPVVWMIG